MLLVAFLINFRLAREILVMYVVYVAYARYICIHLRWLLLKLRIRRVLFSTLLTQLRACRPNQFALHICIISTVPQLANLPACPTRRLAVCLSLSLSVDQYVHSVLIKCHSPPLFPVRLCITLFSCAEFVSHKCCGKSTSVGAFEAARAGSRGSVARVANCTTEPRLRTFNLSISTLHA